ncbi:hypothetical protein EOM09_02510 [bacterium]|nr:hypothetical protein [bacterium]
MTKEKLLAARNAIKRRKPTFKRVQSHQFAKFREVKWRRPKGKGNKIRRLRRGKPIRPEVGFKSPKSIRGFSKSGFKEVIVCNLNDLSKINSKEEIAILSSKLGGRKKLEFLKYSKENNIQIANFKDIDLAIKSLTKEKKEKVVKKSKISDKKEKTSDKKEVKEVSTENVEKESKSENLKENKLEKSKKEKTLEAKK